MSEFMRKNSSKDQRKIKKWNITWQGKVLNAGGYFEIPKGIKHGIWKEIRMNVCLSQKTQIYEFGEYTHDIRYGFWKYKLKNKIIGGGIYNEYGMKERKWIELQNSFLENNQVFYWGEYKNGIKQGLWDFYLKNDKGENLKFIGGGCYDQNGLKNGMWMELSKCFNREGPVIYQGQYYQGKKVGKWKMLFQQHNQWKTQDFKLLGGGSYNDGGFKQGTWIEEGKCFSKHNPIIYNGQYQNGIKLERWDITYWDIEKNEKVEAIGGGSYNLNGMKDGRWIELEEGFNKDNPVILRGDYQNNQKINRWDFCITSNFEYFQVIGGGEYDESGKKKGIWIEIHKTFSKKYSFIRTTGQYKNGKKYGIWKSMFEEELIGQGSYDKNGTKEGKWIDLSEDFSKYCQVIYQGQYNDGKKINNWDIKFRYIGQGQEFQKIGGGFYNMNELKQGKWIDLSDNFYCYNQTILIGEYMNGQEQGRWDEMKRDHYKMQEGFKKICEITYD